MKGSKVVLVMLSVLLVFAVAACGAGGDEETPGANGADENGNEENGNEEENGENADEAVEGEDIDSLTMGFVPSQDAGNLADTAQPLADRLTEILEVEVTAQVMTDYTGLIEGMRTEQIDIGFLPPFGFVQAEERANVQVLVKAERHGEDSYKAQYVASADLDADSIEDLAAEEGYRWAYPDSGSASGFLFPGSQLMELGVDSLDTHFNTLEVGGHDNAIIAILNGDADFATTFDDAREVVEDEYPEVMEQTKIIGYTDPIPNDTVSVRAGMSEEWAEKIKDAFLSFNDDEEMLAVLDDVYSWTGVAEADSAEYEIVRETFEKFQDQIDE
jgi:phosphonate transport system substrate-binding protein